MSETTPSRTVQLYVPSRKRDDGRDAVGCRGSELHVTRDVDGLPCPLAIEAPREKRHDIGVDVEHRVGEGRLVAYVPTVRAARQCPCAGVREFQQHRPPRSAPTVG